MVVVLPERIQAEFVIPLRMENHTVPALVNVWLRYVVVAGIKKYQREEPFAIIGSAIIGQNRVGSVLDTVHELAGAIGAGSGSKKRAKTYWMEASVAAR